MNNKSSLVSILDPDTNNSYKYESHFSSDSETDGNRAPFQPLNKENRKALLDYIVSETKNHPENIGKSDPASGASMVLEYAPVGHSTPYNDHQVSGSTLRSNKDEEEDVAMSQLKNRTVSFAEEEGEGDMDDDESAIHVNKKLDYSMNKRDADYRSAVNLTPLPARTGISKVRIGRGHDKNGISTMRKTNTATGVSPKLNLAADVTEQSRPHNVLSSPSDATSATIQPKTETGNSKQLNASNLGDSSMLNGFLAFIRSHPHGEELFQQFEGQWKMNSDRTHLQSAFPIEVSGTVGDDYDIDKKKDVFEEQEEEQQEQEQEPKQERAHQLPEQLRVEDDEYKVENENRPEIREELYEYQSEAENKPTREERLPELVHEESRPENPQELNIQSVQNPSQLNQPTPTPTELDLHIQIRQLQLELKNSQNKIAQIEGENRQLKTENTQINDEKSQLNIRISQLKGQSPPITPESLPRQKMYNRLEMTNIDSMSLIEAHNMIKNISLIFDIPSSQLPRWLPIIAKLLSEEDIYLNFAQQIHKLLYNGQELRRKKNQQCLSDMIHVIEKLKTNSS